MARCSRRWFMAGALAAAATSAPAAVPITRRALLSAPRGILPDLPLAPGARVQFFGDSYFDLGAQQNSSTAVLAGGTQTLARSIAGYIECAEAAEAWAAGRLPRYDMRKFWNPALASASYPGANRNSANNLIDGSHQGYFSDAFVADGNGRPGWLARHGYALARNPQIMLLSSACLNDLNMGQTAAQIVGNLNVMLARNLAAGVWTVLITAPGARYDVAGYAAGIPLINRWMLDQAGRRGVRVLDCTDLDGPGAAGLYGALSADKLHMSMAGVRARAERAATLLATMVAPSATALPDPIGAQNLYSLKGLTGTGGTLTNASGQVATGFNVARVAGTASYACSKETIAAGNERQVITVTNALDLTRDFSSCSFRPTAAPTFASLGLNVGDWYEASLLVELDSWPGWSTNDTAGNAPISFYGEQTDSGGSALYWQENVLTGYAGRASLCRCIGRVTSGADRLRWTNRLLLLGHATCRRRGTGSVSGNVLTITATTIGGWTPGETITFADASTATLGAPISVDPVTGVGTWNCTRSTIASGNIGVALDSNTGVARISGLMVRRIANPMPAWGL